MILRRFFVQDIDRKKGIASIGGVEFHHLHNTLRLGVGGEIILFDNSGSEFRASIEEIDRNSALLKIIEEIRPSQKTSIKIILAQGIPKARKMDFIIQKATELGISEIIPIATAHSVPALKGERAAAKEKRWKRIAIEASKQCKRATITEIHPIISLPELLKLPLKGLKLILWEDETETRLSDIKDRLSDNITVIIGPEGGFSKEEITMAKGNGSISVGLGKMVLRTETASIASLAILMHMAGELG